jgi:hypothetical protein
MAQRLLSNPGFRTNLFPATCLSLGIREQGLSGAVAGVWFNSFLEYMSMDYSWTFWCLNPNSGDTGGVLQDDWISVHQWRFDALEPSMAAFIE